MPRTCAVIYSEDLSPCAQLLRIHQLQPEVLYPQLRHSKAPVQQVGRHVLLTKRTVLPGTISVVAPQSLY